MPDHVGPPASYEMSPDEFLNLWRRCTPSQNGTADFDAERMVMALEERFGIPGALRVCRSVFDNPNKPSRVTRWDRVVVGAWHEEVFHVAWTAALRAHRNDPRVTDLYRQGRYRDFRDMFEPAWEQARFENQGLDPEAAAVAAALNN